MTANKQGHALVTSVRSEEHTSELQSQSNLVCRLLLEKKKKRTHDRQRAERTHPAHDRHPHSSDHALGGLLESPLIAILALDLAAVRSRIPQLISRRVH